MTCTAAAAAHTLHIGMALYPSRFLVIIICILCLVHTILMLCATCTASICHLCCAPRVKIVELLHKGIFVVVVDSQARICVTWTVNTKTVYHSMLYKWIWSSVWIESVFCVWVCNASKTSLMKMCVCGRLDVTIAQRPGRLYSTHIVAAFDLLHPHKMAPETLHYICCRAPGDTVMLIVCRYMTEANRSVPEHFSRVSSLLKSAQLNMKNSLL